MAIDTLSASSTSAATSGLVEQRLRQPLADVVLAPPRHRAQPVQRLPGDDADEVRPRVVHLGLVDARPPQPRLLHDVLGVGRRAEHLVGDGEQQAAVAVERLLAHCFAHADADDRAVGRASGSAHAAEYSCDSMPIATLPRVDQVGEPDDRRQLDQRRRPELLEEPGRQLVGDLRRRLGHRLGVLQDVALERAEHRRLPPPRHLAGLDLVEPFVVGEEVVEVEAPRAADLGGDGHVGERLQVGVELVPLLDLAPEGAHVHEHLAVVPEHLGRLGDGAELLAGHPLQQCAEQPGDLGLRDPRGALLVGVGVVVVMP